MKIRVINPNTNASMTAKIGAAAQSIAAPGTTIETLCPDSGPASIEGPYDGAFCVPGLLELVRSGDEAGCDGFVIACFDDPAIAAARSLTDRPVIGICEAAMHAATMLAASFSVVTTLPRAIPIVEALARNYGFERHCRRVRAAGFNVLSLEDPESSAVGLLEAEISVAMNEDNAEAIILGCAGMTDLTKRLTEQFELPVIDGVGAAVKFIEALVGLGYPTSKCGLYARPLAKTYAGEMGRYALG